MLRHRAPPPSAAREKSPKALFANASHRIAPYGICASPTMAGQAQNIYLTDDAGFTHILRPGRTFHELGRNVLENIDESGAGGNPCMQESFYTSPAFEGSSMYLRGEEYLYCIGGH